MRLLTTTTKGERGSALIEFTFSTLIWVPLLLGVIGIGVELVREIQVTEVCRDASRMYAYGVDFSQSYNQQLVIQIAPNLGIKTTGGNGAIILSTIKMISADDCTNCTNFGYPVFQSQTVIGNSQYKSAFGTPKSATVSQSTMLNSPSDRAALIAQFLPKMTPGQKNPPPGLIAYVGEVFANNSDLSWTGIGGSVITSQSIF